MPFIVTTKRPEFVDFGREEIIRSRRAVATLEEVQVLVSDAIYDAGQKTTRDALPAFEIQESGGTVGPLPNGTVIEVGPCDWATLRRDAGISDLMGALAASFEDPEAQQEIVAAYNAAQGS